ncbi:class I SAM-dependent methyltransferase [Hoeflea sp. G2-23]|uniref:Class I SAM-dependent methyltransferase n=1 Tax=Hoeflea algicola TaxID=2983763 RepID=A0ABT3ZD75_9HYPH|nr:methyltransferase domain-containing protein [Hoeflea algicola]MCY0149678.1 class I SAM-dependent methyltransferase [Hoeflea algicola]
MARVKNKQARDMWLQKTLRDIPGGESLIDIGAGECDNAPLCEHLDYTSQDIAEYDGAGNSKGLHTKKWNFKKIDLICDLYEIPEDRSWDNVLCSEVLEHVVDPVRAIQKMARIVSPGGRIVITAPFNSLTHFAPYHFCTGFSEYFYRHHFSELGFEIEKIEPNGGFFDFMDQEIGRSTRIPGKYSRIPIDPISFVFFQLARMSARLYARLDGPRNARRSSELQTFGFHVVARRPQ